MSEVLGEVLAWGVWFRLALLAVTLGLVWIVYFKVILARVVSGEWKNVPYWAIITLIFGFPLLTGGIVGLTCYKLGLSALIVVGLAALFASPVSIPLAFVVANFLGWGLDKWEIFRMTRRQRGT